jgi:hypothetical protein
MRVSLARVRQRKHYALRALRADLARKPPRRAHE